MKLSVIIPVYNEAATCARLFEKVKSVPIQKQIIVVNDCSTDGSGDILKEIDGIELIQHQANQGKVAIHKGGLFGVGPGKSVQRNFVYASSSDFIFAIMVEEYGLLIGAFLPLLLYMILFFRAIKIATKSASLFGGLIASGLAFSLVFQAMTNMAVAVGLLPVTGQTLPLISMGGTSILFTCITIGIILSVSRDSTDRNYETA